MIAIKMLFIIDLSLFRVWKIVPTNVTKTCKPSKLDAG